MPSSASLRLLITSLALSTAGLSACVTGSAPKTVAQAPGPDRELAVPARIDAPGLGAEATSATTAATGPAPTATQPARRAAAVTTTTVTRPPAAHATSASTVAVASPGRSLLAVDDRAGDAGPTAPPYADATRFSVEDTGSTARIAVTFAGSLPARLADGEVMGVGIDVFRSPTAGAATAESDYQLYADGGSGGWFGYLQTGNEVVRFPGDLELSGSTLTFTVPWSAIGDVHRAGLSVFVDWSRRAAVNLATGDHVPDAGTLAITR